MSEQTTEAATGAHSGSVEGALEAALMSAIKDMGEPEEPRFESEEPVEVFDDVETVEAAPEIETVETSEPADRFSSVSRDDLDDPRLQRMHDQLQADFERRMAEMGNPDEDRQIVQQNANFIRQLEQNPALAKQVLQLVRGDARPTSDVVPAKPAAPAFKVNAEELGLDEESAPIFEKFGSQMLQALQEQVQGLLAPVQATVDRMNGVFHQAEADREMGDLDKNYPGWQSNLDPKSLAAAKKYFVENGVNPKLVPARMLYQAMDYARLQNENHMLRNNAQKRTPEAPRGRVVGTRSPAAVPAGRRQETVRQVTDLESALEATLDQMGIRR